MRPPASQVLFGMFMRFTAMSEESADDFARGELRILGIFAALLGVEAERAAAVRVAEIEALRPLLTRGVGVVPHELSAQLQAALDETAGSGRPEELAVSALEARMSRLQEGFVQLQAWLEEHAADDAARELLADCWAELHASVARKAFPLP
ncbi:MAG TPA: hypothetical protein VFJ21_06175 [Mycobacteriales bacterium]|jgi:hypothetical protein|nr:hypothetical protein [Mycobacteriales bacterium]